MDTARVATTHSTLIAAGAWATRLARGGRDGAALGAWRALLGPLS